MRRLLLFLLLASAPGWAEDRLPVTRLGHVYAADAFAPARLPYFADLDRLIAEYDLPDGVAAKVRRENFGGDETPEWLVVSPDSRCRAGVCEYALIDGQTGREIGRFFGLLIVLDRRHNGFPVIQTLTWQDEGFSSLRTYRFAEGTYQADDDVLIGEAERRRLEASLELKR